MSMWNAYKIRPELRCTQRHLAVRAASMECIKDQNKENRLELWCALMTLKSESMVCGMHKTSRIELCLAKMTAEGESKVGPMHKRKEGRLNGHQ